MMDGEFVNLVLLPIGLGLLGFVEPCSMGSNLLFIKYVEGKNALSKITQVGVYTLTRAVFIGLLGALAAIVGSAFLGIQKSMWVFLGGVYMLIGILYIFGKASVLKRSFGPSLMKLSGVRGSLSLGLVFGLNIPACAAPLIFALLGTTALSSGGSVTTVATGFFTLALFGLALSLPLLVALSWERARIALDKLAALSARLPLLTGVVFIGLGLWSIYFGLFVSLEDWS